MGIRTKSHNEVVREILEKSRKETSKKFLISEYNYTIQLRKNLRDFIKSEGDTLTLGDYKKLSSEVGRLTLKIEEIKDVYYEKFNEKILS